MTDPTSDLIARTRALRPLIESEAARAEAETTTTQAVVDAVAAAELFWILVPKELGGSEAPLNEVLETFEELAYADITQARTVFEWGPQPRPGQRKKSGAAASKGVTA